MLYINKKYSLFWTFFIVKIYHFVILLLFCKKETYWGITVAYLAQWVITKQKNKKEMIKQNDTKYVYFLFQENARVKPDYYFLLPNIKLMSLIKVGILYAKK